MNSTNLALEVFPFKKTKTVRISTILEVRNLSPEVKEWNRLNNFSKKERNETMNRIFEDREFIRYLETRSNNTTLTSKEYRERILTWWQKREQLLSDIRNTPFSNHHNYCPIKTILFFFNNNNNSKNYRPHYKLETPYYKSFLYPI